MRSLRSKKKNSNGEPCDNNFQIIVSLVKNLNKKELEALKEGVDLTWQAINKVSQAKIIEKEQLDDIDNVEMILET